MAELGGTYEAGNDTMREGGAIPPGWALCHIAKSEKRGPNDKGNSHIEMEFEVEDGDHKGRRFWVNLNLWNSNAKAVEISQRELNSICHAAGKLRIGDTEELHHIPMWVKIGYERDNRERNQAKGYKPMNAQPSAGASSGGGAAEQSEAKSPPWAKSA